MVVHTGHQVVAARTCLQGLVDRTYPQQGAVARNGQMESAVEGNGRLAPGTGTQVRVLVDMGTDTVVQLRQEPLG